MVRRLLVIGLTVATLTGCGASTSSKAPSLSQARKDLAGAPPALAGLHAEASQVLPGGADAFRRRLTALRGHPVVVNKWASWCAPCRLEFPVFQRVSVKLGRRVAFLGVDGRDSASGASGFLRRFPLSYPSYSDPRDDIARVVMAPEGFPITSFYDRAGKIVFQHAGPYTSDRRLEDDIRRYALGS